MPLQADTPHTDIPTEDPCAKVTVFAFALSGQRQRSRSHYISDDDGGLQMPDQLSDWIDWEGMGVDVCSPPRDRNYKIVLKGIEGHDHNIPSISFVNTDQDPYGSWLLSTDIAGELKIWRIWQGVQHRKWDLAGRRMRAGFFRQREGGWLVAALDPRSFRLAKSMEEFCGHSRAPQYHDHGYSHTESYDLTNVVRLRTPGNSQAHPLLLDGTEDDTERESSMELSDSWPEVEEAIIEPEPERTWQSSIPAPSRVPTRRRSQGGTSTAHPPSSDPLGTLDDDVAGDASSHVEAFSNPTSGVATVEDVVFHEAEEDVVTSRIDGKSTEAYLSSDDYQDAAELSSNGHQSTTSLSSLAQPLSEDLDIEIYSASDLDSPLERRHRGDEPLVKTKLDHDFTPVVRARKDSAVPSIPTLHCSSSNLRLLIAPEADSPHIFCANILKQALPHAIENSNHANIDRLNMMVQIPELGIVVVATQMGRCAVCTLTKLERTGSLGLRVDWILPTKSQEFKGVRPIGPLLGIAASPVQGHFIHPWLAEDRKTGEARWGQDGIIDGVVTTFDPHVLVVESVAEDAPEDPPSSKRKRQSRRSVGPESTKATLEPRAWRHPPRNDSFQSMDGSRRYRLMLTYLDMTVLSYEISRGIEKLDISRKEVVSVLEQLD
jgi:hypothetical protein